jgi:uncharacterized protein YoxC
MHVSQLDRTMNKSHNIHMKLDAISSKFEQHKVESLNGLFDMVKDLAPGLFGLSPQAKETIKALVKQSIEMCTTGMT